MAGMSGTSDAPPVFPEPAAERRAPLLDVLAGRTPRRTPVWFMRQAGRSLPEYRRVREGIGMLEACFRPDMAAEITLQPVRRHDVDAAIFFSDIVVPLKVAGVGVDIVPGRGPVMDSPVRTAADVANLPILEHEPEAIAEAIAGVREGLAPHHALIGFAGAPFTLASYLVEGGPSKNHVRTKALMHGEPQLWHRLMERLVPTVATFLHTQIRAGADAVQLFDSWAGFLSPHDYRTYVLPHSRAVFQAVADTGVPRIHFGVATGEILPDMAETGCEALGVDWRVPLDRAARRIHARVGARVLQGNLDPALLCATGPEADAVLEQEVQRILGEARRAIEAGHARGHIVNLGHGVLPVTSPEAITRAVQIIHRCAPLPVAPAAAAAAGTG